MTRLAPNIFCCGRHSTWHVQVRGCGSRDGNEVDDDEDDEEEEEDEDDDDEEEEGDTAGRALSEVDNTHTLLEE